jgi:hypothetical protein
MGLADIPASVEGGAPHPPPAAFPPRRGDTSHGRRLPPSAPAYELPVRRCMAFAQKDILLQGYEVRRQRYLSSVCPSPSTYLVQYTCIEEPTSVFRQTCIKSCSVVHAPFRVDPLLHWTPFQKLLPDYLKVSQLTLINTLNLHCHLNPCSPTDFPEIHVHVHTTPITWNHLC